MMLVCKIFLGFVYVTMWMLLSFLVTVLYKKTGGFDHWKIWIDSPGAVVSALTIWPITFIPIVLTRLLEVYVKESKSNK